MPADLRRCVRAVRPAKRKLTAPLPTLTPKHRRRYQGGFPDGARTARPPPLCTPIAGASVARERKVGKLLPLVVTEKPHSSISLHGRIEIGRQSAERRAPLTPAIGQRSGRQHHAPLVSASSTHPLRVRADDGEAEGPRRMAAGRRRIPPTEAAAQVMWDLLRHHRHRRRANIRPSASMRMARPPVSPGPAHPRPHTVCQLLGDDAAAPEACHGRRLGHGRRCHCWRGWHRMVTQLAELTGDAGDRQRRESAAR